MQLANLNFFWILLLPALLLALSLVLESIKRNRLRAFIDSNLLNNVLRGPSPSSYAPTLRASLSLLIGLLLALSVLRPQWGFSWVKGVKSGVDIIVAVDVSQSMLSNDLKPNRLELARREIVDLMSVLRGDRIGLVAFAGTAFIETPLTLDYNTFRMFIDEIDPSLIPIQGTNIEAAISKSTEAFGDVESATGKAKRDRALILITDGEDFEGNFSQAAKTAKENDIKIYIIGVGTTTGGPIPTDRGLKRDKSGNVIITKLNEDALKNLAKETGAVYVSSISSSSDTNLIYNLGIKKDLKDRKLEEENSKKWNEYFQLPLLLALILLILQRTLELGVLSNLRGRSKSESNATNRSPNNKDPLKIQALGIAALLLIPFLAEQARAETQSALKKAYDAFGAGEFETAASHFDRAIEERADSLSYLGKGSSHYRMGDFKEASTAFLEAAKLTNDAGQQANALYNAGNALTQLGEYQEAIKVYEEALKVKGGGEG
ncbi:hypothetical protein BVY02_02375 [bacterium J17]|nr:hypothetical protein BVY02_02375 [bacterium J17]